MLVYADLHVHIGRGQQIDQAVKITGSAALTLANIVDFAPKVKGITLLGIIDAGSPVVQEDIRHLLETNQLTQLPGGGCKGKDCTLILGTEVELSAPKGGSAHFLAYFPSLQSITEYTLQVKDSFTNINLSSQTTRLNPDSWLEAVSENDGVVVAAHAFTPHKGVYGNCVASLDQMFTNPQGISGIELGLSCNTNMALKIADTHRYTFLTNSDAHSLAKIAREYTVYDLPTVDFASWQAALAHPEGKVIANYGLDPLLGKYYRSFCLRCQLTAKKPAPVVDCPNCGGKMVMGVLDRIESIGNYQGKLPSKPPYTAQTPLEFIPKLGPRTYQRLLARFQTEMNILHQASLNQLTSVVGTDLAERIIQAREGKLQIKPGGGGVYGKVIN